MDNINQQLAQLQKELNDIDLTKALSVDAIEKMGTTPIKTAYDLQNNKGLNSYNLDAMITSFKTTIDRLSSYRPSLGSRPTQQEVDAEGKKIEVKQIIKDTYDELTKKKEIIEAYSQKYDITQLENLQATKLKGLEQANENYSQDLATLSTFQTQFSTQFNNITNCQEKLDDLNALNEAIEDLNFLLTQRTGVNSVIISEKKSDIVQKRDSLSQKYGLTLSADDNDFTALQSDIIREKAVAAQTIQDSKNEILQGAKNASEYKKIYDKLLNAGSKSYIDVLNDEVTFNTARMMEITNKINKVQSNLRDIHESQAPVKSTIDEDEIASEIASNSSLNLPALSKKELQHAVYQKLIEGKEGKIHPLLWLKSNTTKAQEAYMHELEEQQKEKAIDNIKQKRQNEKSSRNRKLRERQAQFTKSLTEYVLTNNHDINKMHKNATTKNGPQDDLAAVYGLVQDEMDRD